VRHQVSIKVVPKPAVRPGGDQHLDVSALVEQLGDDAAPRGIVLDVDHSRRAHGAVLQAPSMRLRPLTGVTVMLMRC